MICCRSHFPRLGCRGRAPDGWGLLRSCRYPKAPLGLRDRLARTLDSFLTFYRSRRNVHGARTT